MKKTKFGTFRNCKRTLCDKSCLINLEFVFIATNVSWAFSCGKILKYTVATDKSVVTLTLDTEIIKFETPFFSHFTL